MIIDEGSGGGVVGLQERVLRIYYVADLDAAGLQRKIAVFDAAFGQGFGVFLDVVTLAALIERPQIRANIGFQFVQEEREIPRGLLETDDGRAIGIALEPAIE